MAIQWEQTPLDKETLGPGQTWSYRLPLRVQGAAPAIQWGCVLLPSSALTVDSADPRQLTICVPADTHAGFGDITYQISDVDGPVRGRILLRIQAPSSSTSALGAAGPETGEPPIADPSPIPVPKPESDNDRLGPPGTPEAQPQTTAALSGTFRIDVIRNGVPVPQLKSVLALDRTTVIGKSSLEFGIPDLDLHDRFEALDLEKDCSRRQAEVFWSEGRIWLRTLGKHPLKFLNPDGACGEIVPKLHCWAPDQVLVLPGNLRLVLRKERS